MENLGINHFHIDADHWPTMVARINAESFGDYGRFRRSLNAYYPIVWRDIALGYLALGSVCALVAMASGIIGGLISAIIGAVAIGYIIAYLQLFIHEGAHWNLAADRSISDRICNVLIAWQVGTSVAAYRKVHFDHHRYLGQLHDGERSYAQRLDLRLLLSMVTGLHALRIFVVRRKAPKTDVAPTSPLPLVRGIVTHLALLSMLVSIGAWAAALAWAAGMAIFFPLFATLRPLLEHRPAKTDTAVMAPRGEAVTRMFKDGFLARTLGGVGFSRHLLHHWEPQVSYTRLRDLEIYLATTSICGIIDARRTTYLQAFRDILATDNGR